MQKKLHWHQEEDTELAISTDVIVNTISNMSVMRRSAANKLPHKINNGHKCISFLQHRHRYITSFMWQLVCCTSSHCTHFRYGITLMPKIIIQ